MAEKSRVMLAEQLNKDTSTVANEQRAAFEQRERDLLETIREKNDRINELETDIEVREAAAREVMGDVQALQEEKLSFAERIETLTNQLNDADTALEDSRADSTKQAAELNDARQHIQTQDDFIEKQGAEIARLERELAEARGVADNVGSGPQRYIKALESEREKLENDLKRLVTEICEVQNKLADTETENKHLRSELSELRRRIALVSESLDKESTREPAKPRPVNNGAAPDACKVPPEGDTASPAASNFPRLKVPHVFHSPGVAPAPSPEDHPTKPPDKEPGNTNDRKNGG